MNKVDWNNPEPSPELRKNILLRIEREEWRKLLVRTISFGTILLLSLFFVLYGIVDVLNEASRSGFSAFVSLFFSDSSATLASFSNYMLSLIESFPIYSTVLLLSGLFFMIWSASRFTEEVTLVRKHTFSASH